MEGERGQSGWRISGGLRRLKEQKKGEEEKERRKGNTRNHTRGGPPMTIPPWDPRSRMFRGTLLGKSGGRGIIGEK